MENARWEQIELLYNKALQWKQPEREMFLRDLCGKDQSLLFELKSLLKYHEKNDSFLEKSVLRNAAQLLNTRPNELTPGKQFGIYKILNLLGTGGMGEVYLAEDTRLGRQVALKILPSDLVHNASLVQRFELEARAASALNHPNILTIYEIGQDSSGIHFIAAEYIDGETLRQILSSKRQLKLAEIVGFALQTASALAAAHQAGVIHRDIKPQNIMVRRDGYVKVLDFGIAKLMDKRFLTQKSNLLLNTDTGVILGTASYMSPEQARGLKVNDQTDLWSFGVTLYEMLTTQVPFTGASTSDVIVSILEREPLALAELVSDVPPELERIIKRCLNKDIAARYKRATEIIEDLQRFQKQIQTTSNWASLVRPAFRPKNRVTAENNHTTDSRRTLIEKGELSSDAFSLADFFKYLAGNGKTFVAAAIVCISFVVGIAFTDVNRNLRWLSQSLTATNRSVSPFQQAQINRLTNTGNVALANLSPDGKYLAYVVFEQGQQSLWLRQTASSTARKILELSKDWFRGISFSPDNNFIYYVVYEKAKGKNVLYAISVVGSEPRRILEDVDSPPTFAPDEQSFAFVRGSNEDGIPVRTLLIANLDGTQIKTLAIHRGSDLFSLEGFVWLADGGGKIIIATTQISADEPQFMHLVEIQTPDGAEQEFTTHRWKEIGRLTALKTGNILMTAIEQLSDKPQIYQLSSPTGRLQLITKDLNGYYSISGSFADAKTVAVIQSDRISHIWSGATNNLDQMKRITPGFGRYYQTVWTPDKKIIYVSEESGNQDVWIMEANGSNPKQLTFDLAADLYPKVTPDNRYIIFASNRSGAFNLWKMDRDGGNPKMLTDKAMDNLPYFSLDNKFIYYTAHDSGNMYLTKVSLEDGAISRMFDFPSIHGTVSPDGKSIACLYTNGKNASGWQAGIASIAEGKIIKTFDIPIDVPWQVIRWTPAGDALVYLNMRDGNYNLWKIKISNGQPEQLTHFNSSDQIFYYDWSQDGQNLVCLRGQRMKDVILLNALTEPAF